VQVLAAEKRLRGSAEFALFELCGSSSRRAATPPRRGLGNFLRSESLRYPTALSERADPFDKALDFLFGRVASASRPHQPLGLEAEAFHHGRGIKVPM